MSTDTIAIDNIGPIDHLELGAKPGTITVLRGMNGEGKSTALDAVGALTRGSGKLESRDGTVGGKVSGFGVTIKVGRGGANRRTGDLVVTAVEDRLSIADFVDPKLKDLYAADAKRLKALIGLAGVKPDTTIYHQLAGGLDAFKETIKPETLEALDPIRLAEGVKRDFEAASRIHTTRAERLFGEIKAKLSANEGLTLTAEHDAGYLQRRLESCLETQSALNERARLATADHQQRTKAREQLEAAQRLFEGRTIADAQEKLQATQTALDARVIEVAEAVQQVEAIRQQLARAEQDLQARRHQQAAAEDAVTASRNELRAVQDHESTLSAWRESLDRPAVDSPTDRELEAAQAAVEDARKAHETGVLIRAALQRQTEADGLEQQRAEAVKRADFLRDAAKSVFDTLAGTITGLIPGLILDPELRIIVPHRKRGQCFYADLSHGERWRLALDIAVASFERVGERGVLAIPQEAWEGLDGRNRKLVADKVATTDLIVFTAEADRSLDGPDNKIGVEVIGGAV